MNLNWTFSKQQQWPWAQRSIYFKKSFPYFTLTTELSPPVLHGWSARSSPGRCLLELFQQWLDLSLPSVGWWERADEAAPHSALSRCSPAPATVAWGEQRERERVKTQGRTNQRDWIQTQCWKLGQAGTPSVKMSGVNWYSAPVIGELWWGESY